MSDNPDEKRQRDLTPKPRSPIHRDMGRYGMNNSKRNDLYTHNDHGGHGMDEVDNVMSKMVQKTGPLPVRKKIVQRSFSHSDYSEYSDDDDKTDSSDFENGELYTPEKSRENSYQYRDQYSRNISDSPYISKSEEPRSKNIGLYLLLSLVVIMIALSWQFLNVGNITEHKGTQTVNNDEIVFENNMDNLKQKYNIDDNSILKIKTGISTIFSRMDAGSFMFLYNSKTVNFDPMRFDKFINEVAHTAARYLRNTPVHHTVVVSSSLDMQEHGELISKYRDDVDKTGVMLVKEVDEVPSDLAMAFHYYCDEYDPLVKRSAIFFTLNLANCSNTADKKSTHDFIEKCLARKWQSVPQENIRPLLTRIVDIIIDVTRVF